MLEYVDLTLSTAHGDGLEQVSFALPHGSKAVIFGTERSGIDLFVAPLVDPGVKYEGDVRFNGTSVKDLGYVERLPVITRIGYIHGEYGLISNMSVRQNITLPLEYHSDLSEANIALKVEALVMELGLQGVADVRPIGLSRSEILKAAYARAIVHDPDLLIMEHAMESQCPLNILSVQNHLRKYAVEGEKTLLIISFEPEKFLDLADRYVMLHDRHIVFSGNAEEFRRAENPYVNQYRNVTEGGPIRIDRGGE